MNFMIKHFASLLILLLTGCGSAPLKHPINNNYNPEIVTLTDNRNDQLKTTRLDLLHGETVMTLGDSQLPENFLSHIELYLGQRLFLQDNRGVIVLDSLDVKWIKITPGVNTEFYQDIYPASGSAEMIANEIILRLFDKYHTETNIEVLLTGSYNGAFFSGGGMDQVWGTPSDNDVLDVIESALDEAIIEVKKRQ